MFTRTRAFQQPMPAIPSLDRSTTGLSWAPLPQLQLQRTPVTPKYGNVPAVTAPAAIGHDYSRISVQAKLAVNAPGDVYEQEADRIADQVMRMPEERVQRHCDCGGECAACQQSQAGQPEEEHEQLQTKRVEPGSVGPMTAPPVVHDVLRSGGQSLDTATRNFMEPRFGHDFSQVRIHTDAQAAESSRAVNARAYTVGQDVVFGAGQYAPETSAGKQLLAHELAHVLQQAPQRLSRYTLDDCEDTDRAKIRSADGKATAMAGKALSTLRQYQTDYPDNKADQKVTDLLISHFGFEGSGGFLGAVIEGYKRIHAKFVADDYQYECEDDCDDEKAYVYAIWSDIHLCMNKLKNDSETRVGAIMLHEMSHYIAGTDDIEYYYRGSPASTSLHPTDAIGNADSYEGFAQELY